VVKNQKMTAVEDFIYRYEGTQRSIMLCLHQLLSEQLNLTDKIRFKIPFYYKKSWICYVNPMKDGSVEFAFVRANELANTHGLLESKGRKQVAGITFTSTEDWPIEEVRQIIQEAILLDETVPYAVKRTTSKNS
jgi:hypothetical protein